MVSWFPEEQQPLRDQRRMEVHKCSRINAEQLLVHLQGTPVLGHEVKDESEVFERDSEWSN